jgi:AcrR family transcriptional regulator
MKKKQTRMKPPERREQILAIALELAIEHGYTRIGWEEIAARLEVSTTALRYHFTNLVGLKAAVMRHALVERCAIVVAQGLALRDPLAAKADDALRAAAQRTLGDMP